jgi:hypothetical protein
MAPTYRVFVAHERPKIEEKWLPVGFAIAHEDGKGFDITLEPTSVAMTERLVLREQSEADSQPTG